MIGYQEVEPHLVGSIGSLTSEGELWPTSLFEHDVGNCVNHISSLAGFEQKKQSPQAPEFLTDSRRSTAKGRFNVLILLIV